VAVLAQPRHDRPDDFHRFGRPRLFFGISAGNLDSIVANYSGNARVRDQDDYSPGGNPYFGDLAARNQRRRPDRAVIVYANLARRVFAGVPLVLGGLEASLRRFVHYDYQQEKPRDSILADAKGDLLVYGMGERAVLEIARRLDAGRDLEGIAGTCERLTDKQKEARFAADPSRDCGPLLLPGRQAMQADPALFLEAELAVDGHARALAATPILQPQQGVWLLQHPAAAPLSPAELDRLYELPYSRRPHPEAGDVPAFRMVRDSITIVRGCCGNCSFCACAISRHQGPMVISRSKESVVQEAQQLAGRKDFSGTISDLGGPTANLYGAACGLAGGGCKRHDCLYPQICRHLRLNEERLLELLARASAVPGVKHLFVSSGLRMELLLRTPELLRRLVAEHTPGALKIAPEHSEPEVLRLMHKPGPGLLADFIAALARIAAASGKKIAVNPYLIASHPGCREEDMKNLARQLRDLRLTPRQFQDFTPTPGTIATAMYVSGRDRDSGRPLFVARSRSQRRAQRQILEKIK